MHENKLNGKARAERGVEGLEFVYKDSSAKCVCSSSRSAEFRNSDSFLGGFRLPFDRMRKHTRYSLDIGDTNTEREAERERDPLSRI